MALVTAVILLGAIALALLVDVKVQASLDRITVLTNLLGLAATLVTLLVALLLYRRYGIEQNIIEKQSSVVFGLIEAISTTRFLVKGQSYGLQVRMRAPHQTYFEGYYHDQLLVSNNLINGLRHLQSLTDSPFMPRSISDAAQELQVSSIVGVPKETASSYCVVSVLGTPLPENDFAGKLNHQDLTLLDFFNLLENLNEAARKWLRENSEYSANLNF